MNSDITIEVHTTKIKLTKSIINQMMAAGKHEIKNGTAMGHVVNMVKSQSRTMLIKCDGKYYILSMAWIKGKKLVYCTIGRGSIERKFNTEADCDKWWMAYENRKAEAVNQIYI